jgi:hypothetical protein
VPARVKQGNPRLNLDRPHRGTASAQTFLNKAAE